MENLVFFCYYRLLQFSTLVQHPLLFESRAASSTSCTRCPSAKVAALSTVMRPSRNASTISHESAAKPRDQLAGRMPGAMGFWLTLIGRQAPEPVGECQSSPASSAIKAPVVP